MPAAVGPTMTRLAVVDDKVDLLRRCRIALYDDAEKMREGSMEFRSLSRLEWEDRADASEAGKIVGPLEIDAIANLVYGKRRR